MWSECYQDEFQGSFHTWRQLVWTASSERSKDEFNCQAFHFIDVCIFDGEAQGGPVVKSISRLAGSQLAMKILL
jgi:hypothetical protein